MGAEGWFHHAKCPTLYFQCKITMQNVHVTGTNEEIKEFCTLNYGVTFPMMAKISVKGKDIAPLYQWLTHKSENGVSDAKIGWNFHKFLIDENGRWVASIGSTTSPLSQEIVGWIEE